METRKIVKRTASRAPRRRIAFTLAPGHRCHHLTVLGFHHKEHGGMSYWTAQCDCGNVKVIRGVALLPGPKASQTCRHKGCPYYADIRANPLARPAPAPDTPPPHPLAALKARHMAEAATLAATMPPALRDTAAAYREQLGELSGEYGDL